MSLNRTYSINRTNLVSFIYEMKTITYVYSITDGILAVVGTLLNLWLLLAILTSQEMRSRLRNKIICNTLVVHLLDSAIIMPANVFRLLGKRNPGCVYYSVFSNLILIQDFIVNWLIVMLLVVFIAQIKDFNPRTRLTTKAITIGTIGLLILPWVASLIVVPIVVREYYIQKQWARAGCMYATSDAHQLFKSIDTATPIILALLLLIIAAVLRHMRFTPRYSSGSRQAELMSPGPDIDNTFAYAAAVAVCITCDLVRLIKTFDVYIFTGFNIAWIRLSSASAFMSDLRVVLIVLPWFLLSDVRQRVTTWRPWKRSVPGIDLTVMYKKEDA